MNKYIYIYIHTPASFCHSRESFPQIKAAPPRPPGNFPPRCQQNKGAALPFFCPECVGCAGGSGVGGKEGNKN